MKKLIKNSNQKIDLGLYSPVYKIALGLQLPVYNIQKLAYTNNLDYFQVILIVLIYLYLYIYIYTFYQIQNNNTNNFILKIKKKYFYLKLDNYLVKLWNNYKPDKFKISNEKILILINIIINTIFLYQGLQISLELLFILLHKYSLVHADYLDDVQGEIMRLSIFYKGKFNNKNEASKLRWINVSQRNVPGKGENLETFPNIHNQQAFWLFLSIHESLEDQSIYDEMEFGNEEGVYMFNGFELTDRDLQSIQRQTRRV